MGAYEILKNEKAKGFPICFSGAMLWPSDKEVLIGFKCLNSKANAVIL